MERPGTLGCVSEWPRTPPRDTVYQTVVRVTTMLDESTASDRSRRSVALARGGPGELGDHLGDVSGLLEEIALPRRAVAAHEESVNGIDEPPVVTPDPATAETTTTTITQTD